MPALIKPARQNQVFCTTVDRNGGWQSQLRLPSTISSKPNGLAGIQIDGNAATGDFLLSLSPANLTAARRWSFPDRSDTVAGLGAQTFTGAQTFSLEPIIEGSSSANARMRMSLSGSAFCYFGGYSGIIGSGNASDVLLTAWTGKSLFLGANALSQIQLDTSGNLISTTSTASTSTTTGALVVTGGIGCGGRITVDGATTKTLKYVNGVANAAVAVLFGAIGPTGSTAGNAQGWIRIDVAGTDRYIPYW